MLLLDLLIGGPLHWSLKLFRECSSVSPAKSSATYTVLALLSRPTDLILLLYHLEH